LLGTGDLALEAASGGGQIGPLYSDKVVLVHVFEPGVRCGALEFPRELRPAAGARPAKGVDQSPPQEAVAPALRFVDLPLRIRITAAAGCGSYRGDTVALPDAQILHLGVQLLIDGGQLLLQVGHTLAVDARAENHFVDLELVLPEEAQDLVSPDHPPLALFQPLSGCST
jgi:hypothetical protein